MATKICKFSKDMYQKYTGEYTYRQLYQHLKATQICSRKMKMLHYLTLLNLELDKKKNRKTESGGY